LMTLRFIYLKQANPRIPKGSSALPGLFLIDRIHYSVLDVRCSMFDVQFFSSFRTKST
jgi:hypothetical protein